MANTGKGMKIPGENFTGGGGSGGAFASRETVTGQTGTTITFAAPYALGLIGTSVYRNGSLMKEIASPTLTLEYEEATTTTITLGVAAAASDEFDLIQFTSTGGGVSGLASREVLTGVSGVTATFSNPFVIGHPGNMVFRNGALAKAVASGPTGALEYTEDNTTQLTFGAALIAADELDFYQFDRPGTGGLFPVEVTTTVKVPVDKELYIANNASQIDFQLPAIAPVGFRFMIVGHGVGGWKATPNTGQSIHNGAGQTILAPDFIESDTRYAAIELICTAANTDWVVGSGTVSFATFEFGVGYNHSGLSSTTTASVVDDTDKYNFPGDSIAAVSSILATSVQEAMTTSVNAIGGYRGGGINGAGSGTNTIVKYLFVSDTESAIGGTLTANDYSSAATTDRSNKAFIHDGDANNDQIDQVEESTNTVTNGVATMAYSVRDGWGRQDSNGLTGYVTGRHTGNDDDVAKLIHNTVTTSQLANALSVAQEHGCAVESATHIYAMGLSLDLLNQNTYIEKFNTSTETGAVNADALDTANLTHSGATNGVRGVSFGGEASFAFVAPRDRIDEIDYSDDTSTTLSTTLSVANRRGGGMEA